jgi:ankyrin repeat protein
MEKKQTLRPKTSFLALIPEDEVLSISANTNLDKLSARDLLNASEAASAHKQKV